MAEFAAKQHELAHTTPNEVFLGIKKDRADTRSDKSGGSARTYVQDDAMSVETESWAYSMRQGSKHGLSTSARQIADDFSMYAYMNILVTKLKQGIAKMFQQKVK